MRSHLALVATLLAFAGLTSPAHARPAQLSAIATDGADGLVAIGTLDSVPGEATYLVAGRRRALRASLLPGSIASPELAAGPRGYLVLDMSGGAAWFSADGDTWRALGALPDSWLGSPAGWADGFLFLARDGCTIHHWTPEGWRPPIEVRDAAGEELRCQTLATGGGRAIVVSDGHQAFESADLGSWSPWGEPVPHGAGAVGGGPGAWLVGNVVEDECSPAWAAVSWTRDGARWQTATLAARFGYARSGACFGARCVVATADGLCATGRADSPARWRCHGGPVAAIARLRDRFVGAGDGLFESRDGVRFSRVALPPPRARR